MQHRINQLLKCLSMALVLQLANQIQGAEADRSLEDLLKAPIVSSEVVFEEVKAFAERRIPTLLPPDSVEVWETWADETRTAILDNVVLSGEAQAWKTAKTQVEWLGTIPGGPGYQIRKLRYQIAPDFWIPALLYEPTNLAGKAPVILNVNGHDARGKSSDYKQARCINQAKRGMIALNPEWIGMGQLNDPQNQHYKLNQLNLCGTSGVSLFYLAMSKGLDVLLDHPNADPTRTGVTGLSGGGWQTIFISSLDTRVTLANPVAGYSSFRTRARHLEDLGDSEQTPSDLALFADYTHLTAMMAPRPTLLTFNATDNCCFAAPHAMPPLLTAAAPVYRLYGESDRLRVHINQHPGNHNFGQDNRVALYRMLGDFFDPDGNTTDIEMTYELKTDEQLQVPIPSTNATLNSISKQLSGSLPLESVVPEDAAAAEQWKISKRQQLQSVIRLKQQHIRAFPVDSHKSGNLDVLSWRFKINSEWTLSAVEVIPKNPKGTMIILSDTGKAKSSPLVNQHVSEGWRVVVTDLFSFGESSIKSHPHLFGLLVDCVGERNLGVQCGQLLALSGWFKERYSAQPLHLLGSGPRNSTIALVSAAIEPDDFEAITLQDPLSSFKTLITEDWPVTKAPELFCFGLLQVADIPQLKALLKGGPTIH